MKDTEIFDGKTLSSLLKDIHTTTLDKRSRIDGVIAVLTKMITNPDDAVVLVPLLKDFFDVAVKNDDHLIKVATIVQRIISAESYSSSGNDLDTILSDEEKDRLMKNALSSLNAEITKLDEELKTVTDSVQHALK